jgi:hypothetical protein
MVNPWLFQTWIQLDSLSGSNLEFNPSADSSARFFETASTVDLDRTFLPFRVASAIPYFPNPYPNDCLIKTDFLDIGILLNQLFQVIIQRSIVVMHIVLDPLILHGVSSQICSSIL